MTHNMALWGCIGRAAEAVIEADREVATLPSEEAGGFRAGWTAEYRQTCQVAVTCEEQLAALLTQAGVQDGQCRVLRLADGRLLVVALALSGMSGDGPVYAEGRAWEVSGDVVDLEVAHRTEKIIAARYRPAQPCLPIAAVGAVALAVQEEGEGR